LDTAYCVEDATLWDAGELRKEAKKRTKDWLDKRRPNFICGGCEQKARFINGPKRNPHFGVVRGYEHDEDCDFLGNAGGGKDGARAPLPDRAPAEGNKEIRYAEPGPLKPPPETGGNGGNAGPANGANPAVAQGPLHETTALRTLLKNLRNRPDYPPANLFLDVPDRGPAVRATDYLSKITNITKDTTADGHTRAYWGQISSAHDDGDGKNLWINCDGKGDLQVVGDVLSVAATIPVVEVATGSGKPKLSGSPVVELDQTGAFFDIVQDRMQAQAFPNV